MDEREFTVEFTGYSNVDFTFDVTVKAFNGYEALRQATNNPRFFGFPYYTSLIRGARIKS